MLGVLELTDKVLQRARRRYLGLAVFGIFGTVKISRTIAVVFAIFLIYLAFLLLLLVIGSNLLDDKVENPDSYEYE